MGNCLDRTLSDDGEESASGSTEQETSRHRSRSRTSSYRPHRSSHNNYTRFDSIASNSSSLISLSSSQRIVSQSQNINQNCTHGSSIGSFQTTNGSSIFSPSSSMPGSLQIGSSLPVGSLDSSYTNSMPAQQVFYLTPNVQRTADQLTEEEQVKLLKRMTLIKQLPSTTYDENKKNKE